jgi:hypothetical protein
VRRRCCAFPAGVMQFLTLLVLTLPAPASRCAARRRPWRARRPGSRGRTRRRTSTGLSRPTSVCLALLLCTCFPGLHWQLGGSWRQRAHRARDTRQSGAGARRSARLGAQRARLRSLLKLAPPSGLASTISHAGRSPAPRTPPRPRLAAPCCQTAAARARSGAAAQPAARCWLRASEDLAAVISRPNRCWVVMIDG